MENVWPKDYIDYLKWRCRMNWHPKYMKFVDDWIKNVTKEQMDYYINVERKHLIENGIY
jgi:hypothetical protein